MFCALLYNIEYVRIYPIHSQSVSVVTQVHNATCMYDVDHMTNCLGDGSLSTSTFSWPRLIAVVDKQISQTATTLPVVFEVYKRS